MKSNRAMVVPHRAAPPLALTQAAARSSVLARGWRSTAASSPTPIATAMAASGSAACAPAGWRDQLRQSRSLLSSESTATASAGSRPIGGGTESKLAAGRLGSRGNDQPPRLFTARYANPTLADHPAAKVRITVGAPRFRLPYDLHQVLELAPTRWMLDKGEAEFTVMYLRAVGDARRDPP